MFEIPHKNLFAQGVYLGGRFHVLRAIAAGGNATVYTAVDRNLDCVVAIKALNEDARPADSAQRFRREIESLSKIKSPYVIGILAHGEHEGTPWYAMPYRAEALSLYALHGKFLAKNELMPLSLVWRVIFEMCLGLRDAYSAVSAHRDIKPSNVLITSQGVSLLDFGAAEIEELTFDTHLIGTRPYVGPEAYDAALPRDHRADQYAIGVTTLELLTNAQPRHSWREKTPPMPSSVNKDAVGWDAIVMRLIQRDPEKRYRDIDELLAALQLAPGATPFWSTQQIDMSDMVASDLDDLRFNQNDATGSFEFIPLPQSDSSTWLSAGVGATAAAYARAFIAVGIERFLDVQKKTD